MSKKPWNSKSITDLSTGKEYSSMTSCAKDVGMSRSKLKDILDGVLPQPKNHEFVYTDYCMDETDGLVKPMELAICQSYDAVDFKHGGPFGTVVVDRKKEVVGSGHNIVLFKHDPTAHGEIEAIRDACRKLKTHDLSGCTLYTTAYPCPMCMSAIMWANIDKVVYLSSVDDTNDLGFRDSDMYKMFKSGAFDVEIEADDNELDVNRFSNIVLNYMESEPTIY